MKIAMICGAFVSAVFLSACGMMGGGEGPAPDTLAAKAPPALPPPSAPVAAPQTEAAPPPEPEDLEPLPADQVKCIPPFVLQTSEQDGKKEARCVAPSAVSGVPKSLQKPQ